MHFNFNSVFWGGSIETGLVWFYYLISFFRELIHFSITYRLNTQNDLGRLIWDIWPKFILIR